MIPELKALEPALKQILYGCVEHVQATKAALYLPTSFDLTEKTYEIVTSYQFNDPGRRVLTANDDLADVLVVKRVPFFVNGLGADQRFAEMLFKQSTDRLLAAPIFSRGRMIGFIDMRDKAGKKPFERADTKAAERIVDDILALLGEKNLFGLAPIKLVEEPAEVPILPLRQTAGVSPPPAPPRPAPPREVQVPAPPPRPAPAPTAPQQPAEKRPPASREAMAAISAARTTLSNLPPPRPAAVDDSQLEILRLALPSALVMPGALFACLSRAGSGRLANAVVSSAQLAPDAAEMLLGHLRTLLGVDDAAPTFPPPTFPFGMQPAPVAGSSITTIQSTPLNPQILEGVVLTVGFSRTSAADAQRALQVFTRGMDAPLRGMLSVLAQAPDRQAIAEALLEPDFRKYPDLAEHSRRVAALAHRFAFALQLPAMQADIVRIAALVHDVGLRMLDYDHLYQNPDLTSEQMRVIAEHPIVGAALVAPSLGQEIAQIVLRHHERVDGKGYPSRLPANQIPLASRIIQIADAWIAMTSPASYQAAIAPAQALERLREGAGSQFDEQLVHRFVLALPQLRGAGG